MSSLFLLTGDNAYELQRERRRWMKAFAEKHGEENLSRREGEALTPADVLNEAATLPFLAEKRLLVIEGVPPWEKEVFHTLAAAVHPAVVVLFVAPVLDKRTSAAKALLELAEVRECTPLSPAQLHAWMQDIVRERGAKLTEEAVHALVDLCGRDQLMLDQELAKLALYRYGGEIRRADVELLCTSSAEQDAWRLLDFLGNSRTADALAFLRRLTERGESPHALWSMLLWAVSSAVAVLGALEEGHRTPSAVVKATGITFGAARSALPLAQKLGRAGMRSLAEWMADADIALKTGGYRATGEAPQELEALLDRAVMAMRPPLRSS